MLRITLMIITKQNPIINTQKINRKEYKYIYTTKESYQNIEEENKRIKEESRTTEYSQ